MVSGASAQKRWQSGKTGTKQQESTMDDSKLQAVRNEALEEAARACEWRVDPTRPNTTSGYAFWHAAAIRALKSRPSIIPAKDHWEQMTGRADAVAAMEFQAATLLGRLYEMGEIIRMGGRWGGNEFEYVAKEESDVAMLDDILTDALRLAGELYRADITQPAAEQNKVLEQSLALGVCMHGDFPVKINGIDCEAPWEVLCQPQFTYKFELAQPVEPVSDAVAAMSGSVRSAGAAFPDSVAVGPAGDVCSRTGMSMRDYFAAKALGPAINANWRDIDYVPKDGLSLIGNAARLAYQLADAMIAERAV